MTKAIILQNQKSYRKYSVFLPVLVFIFKRGCRTAGDEFVETKRGFCWEHVPSQKPLSFFTQQSHFNRFKFIFEAYFSEKATGNTLFFTCFSLYLQERLQNSWR
jgi:hypothetical protein